MKLTKKQEIILKFTKDFCDRELEPKVKEIDETSEYPNELLQKLKKAGFIGCNFPKQYGGSGVDNLTYAMIIEELAKCDASTAMIVSATNSLAAWPVFKFGTEEQKNKYLRRVCEEGCVMAFGLTEPNAGSDASGLQTTAVLDGDEWVINGTKIFITNASVADIYVIFAVTDKSKGVHGISAFIVEYPTEGFTIGKLEKKMGLRGSKTGELVFQNVRIPKSNLIGKEGSGFKIAMTALDSGRISVAACSVGIGQRALNEAIKYSKERVQFGKPISRNQAISFKIADMQTRIQAARLLTHDASIKKENNEPYTLEAAMCKYYASETANYAVDRAVQIHGGYGYIKDYTVERLYRDAKIMDLFEGTTEIQKIVISGQLLRK
jgi:butyryl-CoA dehydrogenase